MQTTPGSCQSSERSLMRGAEGEQTRELRAAYWLPCTVYPGTDGKNMSCLVKRSGSTQHPSPGEESHVTSVPVFHLSSVLFVQVNEHDVLLLCSDARKSFTRDFKNVFGAVPISCGFTFPSFSPPSRLALPSPCKALL